MDESIPVLVAIIAIDSARQQNAGVLRYANLQRIIDDLTALLPWTWGDRFEAQVLLDSGDLEGAWGVIVTEQEKYLVEEGVL